MSPAEFDAAFRQFAPVAFVAGLILFPVSIILKFVLIAFFLKALKGGGSMNPLLAIFLGPTALLLSRTAESNARKADEKSQGAKTMNQPAETRKKTSNRKKKIAIIASIATVMLCCCCLMLSVSTPFLINL